MHLCGRDYIHVETKKRLSVAGRSALPLSGHALTDGEGKNYAGP